MSIISPNLTVVTDRVAEVQGSLRHLSRTRVLVGIPSEKSHRRGTDPINNATLLFIHEHGSPVNNLPARPSLIPGVKESRGEWLKYLRQAGWAALHGEWSTMDRALNAAGLTAMSAVKKKIAAGIPPPLKPATVAARLRQRKGRVATGPMTPLINTAQMLNAITYVVQKDKR